MILHGLRHDLAIEAACMAQRSPSGCRGAALVSTMPGFAAAARRRHLALRGHHPCIVAADAEPGCAASPSVRPETAASPRCANRHERLRDLLPSRVRELTEATRGTRTHGLILATRRTASASGDEEELRTCTRIWAIVARVFRDFALLSWSRTPTSSVLSAWRHGSQKAAHIRAAVSVLLRVRDPLSAECYPLFPSWR